MPIRIPIQVKSNKRLVAQGQEKLRAETPKVAKIRLYHAALELKRRMSKPGKKITYPVNWDSFRQKIKVIVMLRRRKKLPYKRGGKAEGSWRLVLVKTGYTVESTLRGAKYLYGNASGQYQSRIHQGRWVKVRDQANIVIKKLPAAVISSLKELVKQIPQHPEVE